MRIAIAAASPPRRAESGVSRTFHVASAQNAAAGTSLIGSLIIVRNAGLVATSQAAPRPRRADPIADRWRTSTRQQCRGDRDDKEERRVSADRFDRRHQQRQAWPDMGAIADSFATAA